MKNSQYYASKVQKLFRLMKREYGKVRKATFDEPVDAVILAILSEKMTDSAAQSCARKLAYHFVDCNELRVSRPDEIVEVLGKDNIEIKNTVSKLTKALYSIFNRYDIVSLKALTQIGKRSARQVLTKLDCLSPFVCDYVMLTALQGHAIPLTVKMIEYLREESLVHPDADEADIQGFLTRQIPALKAYEFYELLRHESEKGAVRAKNKAAIKSKKTRKSASKRKQKK
jgi:endonuclease III